MTKCQINYQELMWEFSCVSLAAEMSKHEHRQTPQLNEEGFFEEALPVSGQWSQ